MHTQEKVGAMAEKLFDLRARKADLAARTREINKEIDYAEYKLLEVMEQMGTDGIEVPAGTCRRKVSLYPSVEDKNALLAWVRENTRPDMLVVSVNRGSFKEYFLEHNEYPEGVNAYEKATLNFRKRRGRA